jgi:titin
VSSLADKPAPPQNLKVTDMKATAATLNWETPEDDGGCSILGYIVEKRESNRRTYTMVGKCKQTSMEVTQLVKGTNYIFQVFAENECGVSPPAELAGPVTARHPFCKLIF